MKQWEYKLISMADMVKTYAPFTAKKYVLEANAYPYLGRVLPALNKLGQLGWEYVEHNYEGQHTHGVVEPHMYVFKREKKSG